MYGTIEQDVTIHTFASSWHEAAGHADVLCSAHALQQFLHRCMYDICKAPERHDVAWMLNPMHVLENGFFLI